MRGATLCPVQYLFHTHISIHTPHAGSDIKTSLFRSYPRNFNPHSPCGERLFASSIIFTYMDFNPHSPCGERLRPPEFYINFFRFQSTLPMRGATFTPPKASGVAADFNPHSPCGERLCHSAGHGLIKIFQSTLPMRGATILPVLFLIFLLHFNPHSPCGERLLPIAYSMGFQLFQSTLPMRGATVSDLEGNFSLLISIHTPHAGSDLYISWSKLSRLISIHTPHAGSDIPMPIPFRVQVVFQSTLPMRGATSSGKDICPHIAYFNPHSPCGERLHHPVGSIQAV